MAASPRCITQGESRGEFSRMSARAAHPLKTDVQQLGYSGGNCHGGLRYRQAQLSHPSQGTLSAKRNRGYDVALPFKFRSARHAEQDYTLHA